MAPKKIKQNKLQELNFYNALIIKKLNLNIQKGLCGFLSHSSIEAFSYLLEENISFLTVGKISLADNTNIFNVPEKEIVMNRFIEDIKTKRNLIMGSNLHIWITLCNGTIIDPSILLTLNSKQNVLIGSPQEIYNNNGYIYTPYFINDYKDISTIINSYQHYPQNLVLENLINNKIQNMKYLDTRVSGYYS
jgi:hypothetical protein|tara:strand:- start:5298 stop:5870 length:573 start_codon:yes stop_codon:yes gene_type:complete